MIRQLPRIDILDLVPDVALQIITVCLFGLLYYKLINSQALPSRKQYFKVFCGIVNPLTIHYIYHYPDLSFIMALAALLCCIETLRWIIIVIIVLIDPHLAALVTCLNKKEIKKAAILYLIIVFLFAFALRSRFISPFDEKTYPLHPPYSQPSINLIWLIQSHVFIWIQLDVPRIPGSIQYYVFDAASPSYRSIKID